MNTYMYVCVYVYTHVCIHIIGQELLLQTSAAAFASYTVLSQAFKKPGLGSFPCVIYTGADARRLGCFDCVHFGTPIFF